MGSINVVASGDGATASIFTGTLVLGSVATINVTASGTDSTATIGLIDPLSIGTVNVTASGVGSVAVIGNLFGITGNVTAINVTASGTSSFAGIIGPGPTVVAAGDLGTVNVTASGADSAAVLLPLDLTFSNANQFNVTASGDGSFAFGEVIALNTIQNATLTASGVGSLAIEVLDPLLIGTVTVVTSALGDGDPAFAIPVLPFVVIPPPLVVGFLSFVTIGNESTAVLSYGDAQVTNGGVVNASGAGFFDMEQTLHGGFVVNAANTGGFSFLLAFPSVFTDDHTLTTTITSASVFNFIQAGVEFMNISTGVANTTSTPGNLNGNTFDMGTAWGVGHDPFGNFGAGVTTAAQALGITGGVANEIIKAGFTSGGTNAFQTQGQLEIGHGLGVGVAMASTIDATAGHNFFFDATIKDYPTLITAALADALASKGVAGHLAYVEGVFGGNTWIAVAPVGAVVAGVAHVLQVIELVGVTSIVAHDIHA